MLQRVSIALSIIHNPKLLILDEATTALDVVTQGQILEEIVKMEKEMDMTRIMITHDVSVVAASCNKVAVMYAGEFMEIGEVKDVLKNPKHPYTKGLMVSFPSLKGKKENIKAIKGYLPDLSKKYEGCIFEPRCEKSMEICKLIKPKTTKLEDGRYIYCHLYGGDENER
jgi:peptide/nickel transport system ATP-binding protein